MKTKNLLVLLVTAFALAVVSAQGVSAFGTIKSIEVDGIEVYNSDAGVITDISSFAGNRVPVLVRFDSTENAEDARMKVWISGESENAAVSERFDVWANKTYTRIVYLDIPFDLDENVLEGRSLRVVVENFEQEADSVSVGFTVQRESYTLEILEVNMDPEVKAGESLLLEAVLKNRGSHKAEDTFLRVSIPELGLEETKYYGDIYPVDHNRENEEDAVQKTIALRIPSDAQPGLYEVVLEAFNPDATVQFETRVFVVGAIADTKAVSSITSRTIGVGETGEYSLTLVNTGRTIRVYELVVEAPADLNVELSDTLVAVPAGLSKTVKITAGSSAEGEYSFSVDVYSNGEILDSKTFKANVEKSAGTGAVGGATNTAVLLTVILAIIFVVLLIVLIVLLTRKPEKQEEFGESYY